jgi:hypothetical protein
MSRRQRADVVPALSLDSFLDIVTNVVGGLILIAVVTVLSAGDVSVSSGASALAAPQSMSARVLVECADGKLFVVDEERHGKRVRELVAASDEGPTPEQIVSLLEQKDVGDAVYRMQAEATPQGLAWLYTRRNRAPGETGVELEERSSAYARLLDRVGAEGFVYFVVRDDEESFDVFRRARDMARARGIAVGWHPVAGDEPLRLSASGSLGKRVQ